MSKRSFLYPPSAGPWIRLVALVFVLVLASVPATDAEEGPGNLARQATRELQVLARVGEELITVDDFQVELARRAEGAPTTAEGRRKLLNEMVRRRALVVEARRAGYGRHPEVIEVAERMMVTRYTRDRIESRTEGVEISDQEALDFYHRHAGDYTRPDRSKGAVVFLAVSVGAPEAERERQRVRAAQILAEAQKLDPAIRDFGDLARRHSDHRAGRYRGGSIGWLTVGRTDSRWPAAVRDALFALEQPGDLAPPVETDEGFYLVRLVERQSGGMLPFEQVADGIHRRMLRERKERERSEFYSELYAELRVRIDPDRRLDDLPAPSGTGHGSKPYPPPLPTIRPAAAGSDPTRGTDHE